MLMCVYKRYEMAALQAQQTLDEVVPALADAVDGLLKGPSATAFRQLHHMVEDLQRAAHAITLVRASILHCHMC